MLRFYTKTALGDWKNLSGILSGLKLTTLRIIIITINANETRAYKKVFIYLK